MTGDTVDVKDILSPDVIYRVRFEGVQAGELQKLDLRPGEVAIINPNSEGGKALKYTSDALLGKLFVLRINPNNPAQIFTADDVEAGAVANNPKNYAVAFVPKNQTQGTDRYMASLFYRTDSDKERAIVNKVRGIFLKMLEVNQDRNKYVEDKIKELISLNTIIYTRFPQIYNSILNVQGENYSGKNIYFQLTDSGDPLSALSSGERANFDAAVGILILQEVYSVASEWPYVGWDEYYPDGSPITLNWELIIAGLGRVYTETLNFIRGPALIDPAKAVSFPREVSSGNSGYAGQ